MAMSQPCIYFLRGRNENKYILTQENINSTRIFDIGAIVYYLKAVPWELPGFTVEKYYNKLLEIHDHITKTGFLELESNNHRFVIKARKVE